MMDKTHDFYAIMSNTANVNHMTTLIGWLVKKERPMMIKTKHNTDRDKKIVVSGTNI